MTYYFSTSLRGSALPPAVRLILHLGFALLFVYLALRFWRLFRGRQFVATMPGGLHFRSDAKETVIIDWSNISRVAVKPSPPGVVIFLKREKMVRDIIGPFRKRAEAEEFVRHVEARLASAGAET